MDKEPSLHNLDLLRGIQSHDSQVLQAIYSRFYPKIKQYILLNNGSPNDAEDVFQEALTIIYLKVRKEPLELSCSFYTFLYAICRNLWLQQLVKKSREVVSPEAGVLEVEPAPLDFLEERKPIFLRAFGKLGSECQQVLELFFSKLEMTDIATRMGYSSGQYAKKKKYKCKLKLIEIIKSDPYYQDYMHHDTGATKKY